MGAATCNPIAATYFSLHPHQRLHYPHIIQAQATAVSLSLGLSLGLGAHTWDFREELLLERVRDPAPADAPRTAAAPCAGTRACAAPRLGSAHGGSRMSPCNVDLATCSATLVFKSASEDGASQTCGSLST